MIRPIAETTLASDAASIDFISIAADWSHLMLATMGRSSQAASTLESVNARFNNDGAANYDQQDIRGTGASATATEGLAGTSIAIGQVPAASAPANVFGPTLALIPSYAHATPQKAMVALGGLKWGTTTGTLRFRAAAGFWRSAAAINQITLLLSAGNFAAGTRVTLYGMGGI
ncbi:MAG: hypothetical protein ACRDL3_08975 [Solirubrobacterales bacterium]